MNSGRAPESERIALEVFIASGINNMSKGRYLSASQDFEYAARGEFLPLALYYQGMAYFYDANSYSGEESSKRILCARRRLQCAEAELRKSPNQTHTHSSHFENESGNLSCDVYYRLGEIADKLLDTQEAINNFRRALEVSPQDYIYVALGKVLTLNREPVEAIQAYIAALKINKSALKNPEEIWLLLQNMPLMHKIKYAKECLDVSTVLGQYINAKTGVFNRLHSRIEKLLKSAELKTPDATIKALYYQSLSQRENGNHNAALAFASRAFDLDSTNPIAVRAYALELFSQDRRDKAFEVVVYALETTESSPEILAVLAHLYYFTKAYDVALKKIDTALAKQKSAYTCHVRSLILRKLGRHVEALDAYCDCIEAGGLGVTKEDIMNYFDDLAITDKYLFASKFLTSGTRYNKLMRGAVSKNGLDVDRIFRIIINTAEVIIPRCKTTIESIGPSLQLGQEAFYENILKQCALVLEHDPEFSPAYLCQARINFFLKKYEVAVQAYKSYGRGEDPAINAELAECYYKNNQFDFAIRHITFAITVQLNHADLYQKRAKYYFVDGKFDRAIDDYISALKLDPKVVNKKDIFVTIMKLPMPLRVSYAAMCLDPNHVLSQKIHEGKDNEDYHSILHSVLADTGSVMPSQLHVEAVEEIKQSSSMAFLLQELLYGQRESSLSQNNGMMTLEEMYSYMPNPEGASTPMLKPIIVEGTDRITEKQEDSRYLAILSLLAATKVSQHEPEVKEKKPLCN